MLLYGRVDNVCQAPCMGAGIYTGLRTKGGGGCEVLHVYLLCHNVGIPGKPLYFPVQAVWLWPDGRMDWHVYGLDHPRRHFYLEIFEREMDVS